jgi:molybdopterin/thiamine biosynthesis adenylyltransferase
LRLNLVGCGAVARWLLRPLLTYLHDHIEGTFEVTIIDGEGDKARRLADDALALFPSALVRVIPEYLVQGNIADGILNGDFVFACVDNTATIRLISDHAVTLRDVTAMNGYCDWCDGGVQLHVRRQNKNLTPPFANKYRPEYLDPKFPNPGDLTPTKGVPITSEPKCIAACNMTAALMVALLHRVLKSHFGKTMPEFAEY